VVDRNGVTLEMKTERNMTTMVHLVDIWAMDRKEILFVTLVIGFCIECFVFLGGVYEINVGDVVCIVDKCFSCASMQNCNRSKFTCEPRYE
jgi:hypothetical protein